jgi:hypothetical protein
MSKKIVCQILEKVFGHLENILGCFQILENVFGHLENILGCFQIFSKFAWKVFPDESSTIEIETHVRAAHM